MANANEPSGTLESPNVKVSLWQTARKLAVRLWPVIAWLYTAFAAYAVLGSFAFPEWWKHFFFRGLRGLFDTRFWNETSIYLWSVTAHGYPLGLVLVGAMVILVGWLLYSAGGVGIRNLGKVIRPPSVRAIVACTIALILTLFGLRNVPTEYKTLDELTSESMASLDHDMAVLQRDMVSLQPQPPASGYFLFLDREGVGRTFSALQKDLTLAAQTTTKESASETHLSGTVEAISGQAISKEAAQNSIRLEPTAPTPERQAIWLIQSYADLQLTLDLPLGLDTTSWEVQSVLRMLSDRGVQLESKQRASLIKGDVDLLWNKLSRVNAPLLHSGSITLKRASERFEVQFASHGGPAASVSGTGRIEGLDREIYECLDQSAGCKLDARILAIVWRPKRNNDQIALEVIPLAIW